MRPLHKVFAVILFFGIFIISYTLELRLTDNFVSYLITFFSIVFGFFFTAVSVLFGKNFSRRLQSQEDPHKRTRTNLNALVAYFKVNIFTALSCIILLLIINLSDMTVQTQSSHIAECSYLWKIPLCLNQILAGISLGLASTSVMVMLLLFRIFFNGFIEEASKPQN